MINIYNTTKINNINQIENLKISKEQIKKILIELNNQAINFVRYNLESLDKASDGKKYINLYRHLFKSKIPKFYNETEKCIFIYLSKLIDYINNIYNYNLIVIRIEENNPGDLLTSDKLIEEIYKIFNK